MATMDAVTRGYKKDELGFATDGLAAGCKGLSERFWFFLSFALFVMLGPFSVLAVILGLFSLAQDKSNKEASEPTSL